MKNFRVVLVVIFTFLSLGTLAKKPIEYLYIDGNNNTYEISASLLNYIPIEPKNSSSGEYSGGVALSVILSEVQFSEIESFIKSIFKDKEYLADNREMGFGTIRIGNKTKFILRDSPLLLQMNTHLKSLLANS